MSGCGVAAHPGPLVNRRLGDERPDRDIGRDLAVHAQHQPAGLGDPADHREIEFPFLENPARLVLAAGREDHQHALLALAEHDLVGGHAGFAHRHAVEVELDAEPALAGHLDRGRGQPGRAHVLDRDDRVGLHQFEAGLDQQFLGERVADLHGRPLLGRRPRRIRPRPSSRRGCRRARSWRRHRSRGFPARRRPNRRCGRRAPARRTSR